jgi:hypothetical protein
VSRLRADTLTDRTGTSAPDLTHGATSTTGTFSGVLDGGDVTLSGDASVGGTLTYQDADNINSIGIITAQQGIQVSANGLDVTGISTFNSPITVVGITTINDSGLHATGVITATSYVGDGSTLTGIKRIISGTASGTLANGQTVIIQSDGTVAGVATVGAAFTFGTPPSHFDSGDIGWGSVAYDESTDRVLVVYQDADNSDYGTAVVGTVNSDNTITFGTPTVFQSNQILRTAAIYHPGIEKVVFAYGYSSGMYLRVAIIDASDNSVTFGTGQSAKTTSSIGGDAMILTYDDSADALIYTMAGRNANMRGVFCRVATFSGTNSATISFGTEVQLSAGSNNPVSDRTSAGYVGNGKTVVHWVDQNDYSRNYYSTLTVSGSTITKTSQAEGPGNFSYPNMVYHAESGKIVYIYERSNTIKYSIGTISGTSVSWDPGGGNSHTALGTQPSSQPVYLKATYDSSEKKLVLAYRQGSTNTFVTQAGFAGTELTITSNNNIGLGTVSYLDQTYSSDLKGNIVKVSGSSGGRSTVVKTSRTNTNLTSENFIGFSDAAYSDGDTANVQIVTALDDAQSGLTTGSKHYVQTDGTLSTTAGSPSVLAGTAISDTEIIVKQ